MVIVATVIRMWTFCIALILTKIADVALTCIPATSSSDIFLSNLLLFVLSNLARQARFVRCQIALQRLQKEISPMDQHVSRQGLGRQLGRLL